MIKLAFKALLLSSTLATSVMAAASGGGESSSALAAGGAGAASVAITESTLYPLSLEKSKTQHPAFSVKTISHIAQSPTSGKLFIVDQKGIDVLDLAENKLEKLTYFYGSEYDMTTVSPDGKSLIVHYIRFGHIGKFSITDDGKYVEVDEGVEISDPLTTIPLVFSPDSKHLFHCSREALSVYNVEGHTHKLSHVDFKSDTTLMSSAILKDPGYLYVPSLINHRKDSKLEAYLRIFDITNPAKVKPVGSPILIETIKDTAFLKRFKLLVSKDQKTLIASTGSSIFSFDLDDATKPKARDKFIQCDAENRVYDMVIHPTGALIAAIGSSIEFFDISQPSGIKFLNSVPVNIVAKNILLTDPDHLLVVADSFWSKKGSVTTLFDLRRALPKTRMTVERSLTETVSA